MSVSTEERRDRAGGPDEPPPRSGPRADDGPSPRPSRRSFSPEYKLSIVAEYEAAQRTLLDRPEGLLTLGNFYRERGRLAEAEELYGTTTRLHPLFMPAYANLADLLRQTYIASRVTKHALLFYGVACLIYLLLAIISSFGINAIQRAVSQREPAR